MKRSLSLGTSLSSTLAALAALATLTAVAPPAAAQYAFTTNENSFDATYAATPIALTGLVLDEAGVPVSGATVTTVAWGVAGGNNGLSASTSAAGAFGFGALSRRSALIKVQHPSYYTEVVAIDLQRPLGEGTVEAGVVVLTLKKPGRARVIFGGDAMFGRRFLDSDGDG
ncbi:MAG TPA: carboxypeptidase-like regulatory domain-containing protein, partial [Candidatus Nanopelagicales bacterium]|nr:carboxypeptidase-like regulatory domain-containing protein [Candidatus Nanopelagicales bacterium]